METVVTKPEGKEHTLKSGKKLLVRPYKGIDIRMASNSAGGDPTKLQFALIAETCTLDGNPLSIEELDNMSGDEVLDIMTIFATTEEGK